jgi:molybdopterin-guanine dinucleotide biosynthesis protein B
LNVFGIAGYSGSGKTTLLEHVIPVLIEHGLHVSVIKHTHHAVDLDTPGKDSWRHRQAGATEVMVASEARWALLRELRGAPEAELPQLLERMASCDLVLVEGFKRQPIPKLEVYRAATASIPLFPRDPHVVALATDVPVTTDLQVFGLTEYNAIAGFIMNHFQLKGGRT